MTHKIKVAALALAAVSMGPALAQPQAGAAKRPPASAVATGCPMAGAGMQGGMMADGFGPGNPQQMHEQMMKMQGEMAALHSQMQAIHDEMTTLRQQMHPNR